MRELETDRLVIRKFREGDGEDLYEYLSNEEVVKFEPYKTFSREQAYAEAERRSGDNNFLAVCLKNGKLIGNLYFHKDSFETYEVGYVFNRNYWGNGYATEALKALIKYAFEELGVRRIIAMCDPKNHNSWKLLERVGMRREGTLLQNVYFFTDENNNPIWKDTYEYAMLKDEYK
ncbi:MAG: GNAT family N-acetyltransferase [Clostridium sartagoforme]|nr:GNAT family N-acetyltransferase [Clostridium sartagoforme]